MNEFELIDKLTAQLGGALPKGVVGVGDDCAVIPQGDGSALLVSTDAMVEDVHFRRSYFSGEDLGWKLIAVNVSDIAAMGGVPEYAVINLQLSPGIDRDYLQAIYRGIDLAALEYGVVLVGGDTSSSATFSVSLTIIGRAKNPFLRSAAKVGDDLWLSGRVGEAGLGLKILEGTYEIEDAALRHRAVSAHLRPRPELFLSQKLAEHNLANAMIDVSDGLMQDASHIAKKSACSLVFELDKIPCCIFEDQWSAKDSLRSGEDYKILFSAKVDNREQITALKSAFPSLSLVGSVQEKDPEVMVFVSSGNGRIGAEQFLGDNLGFAHRLLAL